jgi:hypothetical protein
MIEQARTDPSLQSVFPPDIDTAASVAALRNCRRRIAFGCLWFRVSARGSHVARWPAFLLLYVGEVIVENFASRTRR